MRSRQKPTVPSLCFRREMCDAQSCNSQFEVAIQGPKKKKKLRKRSGVDNKNRGSRGRGGYNPTRAPFHASFSDSRGIIRVTTVHKVKKIRPRIARGPATAAGDKQCLSESQSEPGRGAKRKDLSEKDKKKKKTSGQSRRRHHPLL